MKTKIPLIFVPARTKLCLLLFIIPFLNVNLAAGDFAVLVGEAPDIGAYEFGGINWKPGYQLKGALFYRNNRAYDKLTD